MAQPARHRRNARALSSQSDREQLLNFRTGPGTGHAIIRKLDEGEIVDVLEETTVNWAKVREVGGVVGYVHRDYIARIEEPPIDPPDDDLLTRVNALETVVALQAVDIAHLKTRVAALEDGGPIDPPPTDPTRQFSPAIAHLNMGVATPGTGLVRYRIKRAFTTHNGSWEPDPSNIYAVPQWARDAYLKPISAPDYHDSAGGDHHIFARVEDAAGDFIAGERIRFAWPDGHDARDTDARHGWCNIPITSSFVPERGEQGAWDVLVDDSGSESIGKFSLPLSST